MHSESRAIVVGVSRATRGWEALEWAASEASARACPLRIVHVVNGQPLWLSLLGTPAGDPVATALVGGRSLLEHAAKRAARVAPSASISTVLELGDPAGWILRTGADEAMIVLGRRHGRSWLGARASSTVARVVRRCAGPVAVIGLHGEAGGASKAGVVAFVDGDAADSPVLDVAFDAARRRGLGLTVLRPSDPAAGEAVHELVAATLAEHRAAFRDVRVAEKVFFDPVAPAMLSEGRGTALLAVGRNLARPELAVLVDPPPGSDLGPVVVVETTRLVGPIGPSVRVDRAGQE